MKAFTRSFVGGPLVGSGPWLATTAPNGVIVVLDQGVEIGRYIKSNLGWVWYADK